MTRALGKALKRFDMKKVDSLFGAEHLFNNLPPDNRRSDVQRVALVAETFVPKIDGLSQTAYLTVRYLQETGREVLIFAPDTAPEQVGPSRVVRLPSVALPMYPEVRLALPLHRIKTGLATFQPDVLHLFNPVWMSIRAAHYARANSIPILANYQTDVPTYLRYYRMGYLRSAYHHLSRNFFNGCNMTLVPSMTMLEELREERYEHLHLWAHGVDTERFHPAHQRQGWREKLLNGRDPDSLLCIFVGRLAKEKSIEHLLDIARAPGIALTIIGDGTHRKRLEQTFAGTNTYFTGYLTGTELSHAFASADAFTFTSTTETFGLVVKEAAASGLPVVVRHGNGVSELVEHGEDGYITHTQDEFNQAVFTLRDDPSLRQRMAQRARENAEKHTWLEAMKTLEEYYQAAIGKEPLKAAPQPLVAAD